MKKNAFTLIELLAVIVILAIIALIAVPIVLNIIDDSKTSSDEQSVELYLDTAEKIVTKKQLSNPNFNPDKCEIQDNGDLKCYTNNELLDTLKIEMKGKMPNKGEITILNNKFNYKNIWFNNKKYYAIATLLNDADNNNEISIGDKYSYKVNDTDTFNFYVLSTNSDNTVNLIMNSNICENGTLDYKHDSNSGNCEYAWYDDGDMNTSNDTNNFGPVTAMQVLYNATKNWNNVPDMDLSGDKKYIDKGNLGWIGYGYGTLETTPSGIKITDTLGTEVTREGNLTPIIPYELNKSLKARLATYDEVTGPYTKCNSNPGSCEPWLIENMKYSPTSSGKYSINKNNGISNILTYWLISAAPNYSHYARYVTYDGMGDTEGNGTSCLRGLRPVITVPTSYLEN